MGNRRLILENHPGVHWSILERLNDYREAGEYLKGTEFGIFRVRGGKIVQVSDPFISGESIEAAKKIDLCAETVDFDVWFYPYKEKKETITGTFIEAFEYIQRHFE